MKLKFKHQDFQITAVDAVCDLFTGQERKRATFSVGDDAQMSMMQNEYGIGNVLQLSDSQILTNMQAVQRKNKLPLTHDLADKQFCIEMETGTGKTFVYSKSIYEMNLRYGFTKFIIVVPSVAIREGVHTSLTATSGYLGNQYNNVPCRYFIYNSAKLSDVRQFATSSNIEIMIINIDAFKKSENIINQAQDRLGGETAMRYIQDTNPVVIIDEPQSVDNTPKAKEAIASLNPLCVLRYSATHREKINLLYRLTPVDAYQNGLVKQIVVSSNQVANDFNKPYIRLLSVTQEGGFKAKIELDVKGKTGTVTQKQITVKPGDDLFLKSGGRELYEGYQIAGIDCTPDRECMEFGNTEVVELGKAIGGVDELVMKRAQIRRTIEAHLSKELRYLEKGIKVLSLFFIDEVKKYRSPQREKGVYAQMFEACYEELMALPKYEPLRAQFPASVTAVHNGYFSQDKKGTFKDTKGDTLADYDTYSTIMKDKEWLLSYDCPLRFIWSHSALKEGWDNPNVFQVCTLIEQKSTFTCRQKIGRGLRLCVNQEGERIEDKDINVLHVMANESFADFADTLQHELEADTGMKFGVLQLDLFQGITYEEVITTERTVDEQDAKLVVDYMIHHGYVTEDLKPTEQTKELVSQDVQALPAQMHTAVESIVKAVEQDAPVVVADIIGKSYTETVTVEKEVTYEDASQLMEHFQKQDYITKTGKVKDTMKAALADGTLDLPKKFEAARQRFEGIIIQANRTVPLRDASREVTVRLNKQMLISPEFQELWSRIKQKTTYRVNIDTEALVADSVKDLKGMPDIPKARLITQTAHISVAHAGVSHIGPAIQTMELEDSYDSLPHIINIISEETLTKRDTVRRILVESGRAVDFLHNPQAFLEQALDIIHRNRHKQAIDGISYVKLDGEEYFALEIFDTAELVANLDKNAVAVEHSVYDYVVYDSSTIEKPFAVALDNDPDVKMFFKIPSKFKIETPIGTYNPDWAVYLERNGVEKLYFVIESKGTATIGDLRTNEQLKIKCGMAHFNSLNYHTDLKVARSWNEMKVGL
ncbi:MAG: DEAD/DEAH box helicase family protein [Rikenellaceae bacterium]